MKLFFKRPSADYRRGFLRTTKEPLNPNEQIYVIERTRQEIVEIFDHRLERFVPVLPSDAEQPEHRDVRRLGLEETCKVLVERRGGRAKQNQVGCRERVDRAIRRRSNSQTSLR